QEKQEKLLSTSSEEVTCEPDILGPQTKELSSLGRNDIKIVKDEFFRNLIDNDLSVHTASTASLSSASFDSVNDDYPSEDAFNFEPITYEVPAPKRARTEAAPNLMATSVMVVGLIQNHTSGKLLRVLFDSGGTKTMIHRRALPPGVNPMLLTERMTMSTLAGVYESGGKVMLSRLRLPELDKNRIVDKQEALVFNSPCRYDIILGSDFLLKSGIDIRYSNGTLEWLGTSIPLRPPPQEGDGNSFFEDAVNDYLIQMEDGHFGENWLDAYLAAPKEIMDAKYEKMDVEEMVDTFSHLTSDQKDDLRRLFYKYDKLFSGKLGLYPHRKIHIDIEENAEPVFSRAYPSYEDSKTTVLLSIPSSWGVKETDWLGYWLTPTGLKPWKKKINAILQLKPPRTLKEMRSFLGAVNYYKDMWPKRAHRLKPLTDESGKKKHEFKWTDAMQTAFDEMKDLMVAECLMAYPDHNKGFQIYTDASDYQMGAVICQNGKPVAYWSRKLDRAQRNYTTMEKELLSIVEVLTEFRTMLLGAKIDIFTDHKNLTFKNINTQRVLRWRIKVEEFSPTFHYIPGPDNVVADALSRLDNTSNPPEPPAARVDDFWVHEGPMAVAYSFCHLPCEGSIAEGESTPQFNDSFYSFVDDQEMLDCFVNLPSDPTPENPLNFEWLREQQQNDMELLDRAQRLPQQYINKTLTRGVDLLCHVKPGEDAATQWKIALARDAITPVLKWFHQVLGHPGENRMRSAISSRYYHPNLRTYTTNFACDACQHHKLEGKGYGHLPERDVTATPFNEVAVDLIGPWTIKLHVRDYEFNALTSIDQSNLYESTGKLHSTYAQSGNNLGYRDIPYLYAVYMITAESSLDGNSRDYSKHYIFKTYQQLVAILQQMQFARNVLRTLLYSNPPNTVGDAADLIDQALTSAMHAMRVNVATTLNSSPGALVFGRDMFLDVPLIADWQVISARRTQVVNESLRRADLKRRSYDYVQGERELKKTHKPTKLGERTEGPYTISQVHVNGIVSIQLRPSVTERINIRRVIPHRQPT
ncbi:LOW QUALITY PROTEIN: hypothetical protein ACHAXR_008651, partial [Thalassiosira sp. AJA248-18]